MFEKIEKLVSAKLPQDDTDAKLMRFENVWPLGILSG